MVRVTPFRMVTVIGTEPPELHAVSLLPVGVVGAPVVIGPVSTTVVIPPGSCDVVCDGASLLVPSDAAVSAVAESVVDSGPDESLALASLPPASGWDPPSESVEPPSGVARLSPGEPSALAPSPGWEEQASAAGEK